jgi:hypothetical protein
MCIIIGKQINLHPQRRIELNDGQTIYNVRHRSLVYYIASYAQLLIRTRIERKAEHRYSIYKYFYVPKSFCYIALTLHTPHSFMACRGVLSAATKI